MWRIVDKDHYENDEGGGIQREYGKTPNGNNMAGRWVYRDAAGNMIDFDQYLNDIVSRYGIELPLNFVQ